MAGHSKWANIKHKKERADRKKGKIFSRIVKEIISAVRFGGGDPKANSKLRIAIQKAKDNNVPNDVIDRNIKKASKDQKDYFESMYEVYGKGGVGIILDIMSDNRNRISSDVKGVLNKYGGSIAQMGAVSFNFEKRGIIKILKKRILEDELFLIATDLGALDFKSEGGFYIIETDVEDFFNIKNELGKKVEIDSFGLEMVPKNLVECSEEDFDDNIKLIEKLEDIDDVDSVFHNLA